MRPGILLWSGPAVGISQSFNEAQAMRPGIHRDYGRRISATDLPSMRPRPCGPGYTADSCRYGADLFPSMRPRPCGPGYMGPVSAAVLSGQAFNEAQAMRPGIPIATMCLWLRRGRPSMRPRPCGPGYRVHAVPGRCPLQPSMRPRPCGPGYEAIRRDGLIEALAPSMRPRPCGPGYPVEHNVGDTHAP